MICENCFNEHQIIYGSGRFCSSKCARSFSTKLNREAISKKIKTSLKNNGFTKDPIIKKCGNCGKNFLIKYKKRNQITCSVKCSRKLTWKSDKRRLKASYQTSKRNSEGNFGNSFNNIRCFYDFNGEQIRCDSLLEKKGLIAVCKKYRVLSIRRSNIYLEYIFDGKKKVFNPDFLIEIDGGKILMECKSRISKNETNISSRPLYYLTIEQKKEIMSKYCIENKINFLWYEGNKIN